MTHFYFTPKELITKTEHRRLDYKSVHQNDGSLCSVWPLQKELSILCPSHSYHYLKYISALTKKLELGQEHNMLSCTEHFSATVSNNKSWNLLLLLFSSKHNLLSLPVFRYLIVFQILYSPLKILKINWLLTEFFCISCSTLEENTERSPLSITSAKEFTKGA